MDILMVSPECAPLLKVGGLADAVEGLTKALNAQGHSARVLLPAYRFLPGRAGQEFTCPLMPHLRIVRWHSDTGIPCYAVQHPLLAQAEEIYGGYSHAGHRENFGTSVLLGQAALALSQLDPHWRPQVLHLHDWSTGLIPSLWPHYPAWSRVPSLLTLHNLEYQGISPYIPDFGDALPLPRFRLADLLHDDQINLLASAIRGADAVTTVSPSYAVEILETEGGGTLAPLLQEQQQPVRGYLNGVDYRTWNPATDPHLFPYNYDVDSLALKEFHKHQLCEGLKLQDDPSIPLIVMIARLCRQKGFDLVCDMQQSPLLPLLSQQRIQLVILGQGEFTYSRRLRWMVNRYRGMRFIDAFSEEAAHKLEAAADFFLMPSLNEPCGLNQLYSMRYGTIPIAHATGGLKDTIRHGVDGFLYHPQSPTNLAEALEEACTFWHNDPGGVKNMQQQAMTRRFEWADTAQCYQRLYSQLAEKSAANCRTSKETRSH